MSTALSEQATLVALDVEEIAEYDRAISDLEYQICDCSPDNPAALEDEKKRLQEKANRLVNNLKDEGIELAYDGCLTQIKRNGQLWLECYQGQGGYGWIEHEPSKEAVPSLRDYWKSERREKHENH